MEPLRVLLADDSPGFLRAATSFLSRFPELAVVGQARTTSDTLSQIAHVHPDLVLLDISMPGSNGLETTRHLKAQVSPPSIIILTPHEEDEYRQLAAAAGADGFVAKSLMSTELLPLIHQLFPFSSDAQV